MGGREGYEAPSGSMGRSKAEQRKKNSISNGKKNAIEAENRMGQANNAKERKENNSEKSPMDDVIDVLTYVLKQDEDFNDSRHKNAYVEWVKKNINSIEKFKVPKNELRKEEQITATVAAGGGGKDTSRNARARKHLITGYRVTSEESRKAGPNVEGYMKKMNDDLKRHLHNWRVMMGVVDDNALVEMSGIDKVVEGLG